ncbi:MAG TPA: hypothetical protein VGJ77_11400 [Gaiellaceae bacterium]
MTRRLHISSSANDRVKRLRRVLRNGRREGVFVVHGYRALRRAIDAGALCVSSTPRRSSSSGTTTRRSSSARAFR